MSASRLVLLLALAGFACQPGSKKNSGSAASPAQVDSTALLNKRPGPDAPRSAADRLVRALYFEHAKTENPFRDREDRTLIDQFFARPVSDLLWNNGKPTNHPTKDMLFDAPDAAIHKTWVEPAAIAGTRAVVYVTFLNKTKPQEIRLDLQQIAGRWRITEMHYPDGTQLTRLLKG